MKWSLGDPLSKLCIRLSFLSTLDVKLKTRWAITGSLEPLVSSASAYFASFQSFQIGQLYLVCGCMTIRRCVTYRNDLRETLTSRSNNCFLNSIFIKGRHTLQSKRKTQYPWSLQGQHRQFVDRHDDSTWTMIVDKFYHFHHHRGITLIADPSWCSAQWAYVLYKPT